MERHCYRGYVQGVQLLRQHLPCRRICLEREAKQVRLGSDLGVP